MITMKKVLLAVAIFAFAGSVSATPVVKNTIEHNEKEGKKDKKKDKKECSSTNTETKSCSKGTEGKGCCSKSKTEEKKEN